MQNDSPTDRSDKQGRESKSVERLNRVLSDLYAEPCALEFDNRLNTVRVRFARGSFLRSTASVAELVENTIAQLGTGKGTLTAEERRYFTDALKAGGAL